jgi:hypothetical protein
MGPIDENTLNEFRTIIGLGNLINKSQRNNR